MNLIRAFEMSDDEVKNMPELFKQLRAGYLEWKRTGRLPDGSTFNPHQTNGDPND